MIWKCRRILVVRVQHDDTWVPIGEACFRASLKETVKKGNSVLNEPEVRLIDVEGKSKKSKRTTAGQKTNSDSGRTTANKPPVKEVALEKIVEEGTPERLGTVTIENTSEYHLEIKQSDK